MLIPCVPPPRSPRDHWEHLAKWAEIEYLISAQMATYLAEGRGLKAGRLLGRIRLLTRRGVGAR